MWSGINIPQFIVHFLTNKITISGIHLREATYVFKETTKIVGGRYKWKIVDILGKCSGETEIPR